MTLLFRRASATCYETRDYLLEDVGKGRLLRHGPSGQVVGLLGPDATLRRTPMSASVRYKTIVADPP